MTKFENFRENICACFKLFFNTIGYPKIIQRDSGIEYKNNIINKKFVNFK